MDEFVGVFVEPWEVNSTRADKIHDALYGFDKKCVVSDVVDRYGAGHFDIIRYDDFSEYRKSSGADGVFIAGDLDGARRLLDDADIPGEDIVFEEYTVRDFVEYADTKDVFLDEIRSMFPFQERNELVEDNNPFNILEEMGVENADTAALNDVARPPSRSPYYSNTED
jgi:hypothetical protein